MFAFTILIFANGTRIREYNPTEIMPYTVQTFLLCARTELMGAICSVVNTESLQPLSLSLKSLH